tara:strand:- start:3634 stop:4782 length:1149 start_codon:yes stop_codon:yes gene_type:complete
MSTEVVSSYNLFVDTERNIDAVSTGDSIQLSLNQTPITCADNQFLRLTLQSFSMYKSFTNVNTNNNKIKIVTAGGAVSTNFIYLPTADYSTRFALSKQFSDIVAASLAATLGVALPTTALFPAAGFLTPRDGATITDNIISFKLTFAAPHGLTGLLLRTEVSEGDAFEILGTNRIRADDGSAGWASQNSVVVNMAPGGDANSIQVNCPYNCQLSSQQNVYLRTDINNTNIETSSYVARSTDTQQSSSMASSRLLARMIIDNDFVNFTTGTQMEYFVSLTTRQITHLRLYITDSHGRDIPQNIVTTANAPPNGALVEQRTLGNRSWEAVIKVDVVQYLGGQNDALVSAPIQYTVPARLGTEPLNKFNYGESGFADVNFRKMKM